MGRSAVVLVMVGLCVVAAHAGEISSPPSHDVYVSSGAPSVTPVDMLAVGPPAMRDDDPVEPIDRDEFLGQVQAANSGQALTERIDPFSGSLYLGMVDIVLPGNGGLDIVVQRYYSSNIWNRVDDALLARHSASADLADHLGGSGWQMHMGKLLNTDPEPGQHTTFIMADGSTHVLYDRDIRTGEKITTEGWIYQRTGNVHSVTTTTGVTYIFDDTQTGAGYSFLGMKNPTEPMRMVQCTRIEDLSDNAIVITYAPGTLPGYTSLLQSIEFDDETDDRSVVFHYYQNNNILDNITVMNGTDTVQRWDYGYGPFQTDVIQVQFTLATVTRRIYPLLVVQPADATVTNPWIFSYYEPAEPPDPQIPERFLIESVESPRAAKTSYTWGAETFDVGADFCTNPPAFLAVHARQTSVYVDQSSPWENVATSTYDYVNGGHEGATTTIVTTDSQTSAVLLTEEHSFHGWGPYTLGDLNMWKVGLETSSTVVLKDDAGADLQTVVTTKEWAQGDQVSSNLRYTSPWIGCGNFRAHGPQTYVKPTSVTRVVKRHDSVPDPPPDPAPEPDSYTTETTNFDNWGNPGLVTETSNDGLERITHLTYWQSIANNQFSGFVQGQDVDPGGLECRQYDTSGRLSHTFTDPQPVVVDEDDVSQCVASGSITGAREVAFTYDHGNLATQTEVATPTISRITTHSNYKYGSPKDTVVTTGTGTDIHYCRDYGPLGTVSWETDGRGCDEEYRTVYGYDELGRRTSSNPPLSDPTTFDFYLDWTKVTVTRSPDGPSPQAIAYDFDRFGQPVGIYNHQTDHWLQFENDALSRRRQAFLAMGAIDGDTVKYDPLGRITEVIHPDDLPNVPHGVPPSSVAMEYAGSLVTVTDENDHVTTYHYKAFGDPTDRRLVQLDDARAKTTTYTYDPIFGKLASVDSPGDQGDRSFAYISNSTDCDNGFLGSETHKESGTTTYEYNCLGLVTKRTRPGPEITNSGYDDAGRLTTIGYPNSTSTVTIGYDGAGRRTSLSNAEATATLHYDDGGRLDTVTQSINGGPQDLETSYTYDNFDRLETMTYPSGQVLTYGWDDRNWLTSLTGADGSGVEYLTNLTYYSSGAPDVVTFANGVTTDYDIDVRNRLHDIVTTGPAPTFSTLADVDYVYDDASNIKEWNNDAAPARTRNFDYDQLNRLTSATSTGLWGDLSFTYDDLGNRLTQTWDGDVTTYVYDFATNRLTGLTGAQLGAFTYDAVGRVKTEARNSAGDEIFSDGFESGNTDAWDNGIGPVGTLVYTFNNADQLEQVEEAGQSLGVYAYDGDGLRVAKTAAGETVYYFRDPSGNTIAEYNTAGDLIANYLYAGGRQLAKAEPDGASGYNISYFHPDHLGSAMVITDDNGVVTWQGDYRPFGEPVSSAGTADRYRFTGHELDTATDLTYTKARYYNARLGRFLSVDPIGGNLRSSQSWNRYTYTLDNPVSANDPDGRAVNLLAGGIGAAIGGALGGWSSWASQKMNGTNMDWQRVRASAAGGAVTGGLAGVTAGGSLIVEVGGGGILASTAGGMITRTWDGDSSTDAFGSKDVMTDMAGGAGGALVSTAVMSGTASTLEQGLSDAVLVSGVATKALETGLTILGDSAGRDVLDAAAHPSAGATTPEQANDAAINCHRSPGESPSVNNMVSSH